MENNSKHETQGQNTPPLSLRTREARQALLATPEGRILATGVLLSAVFLISLAMTGLWSASRSQILFAMTATHLVSGRAAGIYFGYTTGLGHGLVIPINMIIETLLVLLFYPLFVLGLQRLLVFDTLKNAMEWIHEAAENHHQTIRRYGIFGLLLFVWFPFWWTGPLVGSVLGHMLGLRVWVNLLVVLSGTYLAIISWSLVLFRLHGWAAEYNDYAPLVLLVVVILLFALAKLLHGRRKRNNAVSLRPKTDQTPEKE